MSFFKPKTEQIDFETEEDLPGFHFDQNGFLMFDDESLGGCGIFEVTPMVMTPTITHKETLTGYDMDEKTSKRTYEQYGNCRHNAMMQWIDFINGLQMTDEADDPTHVQVILKKTDSSEWITAPEYAENQMLLESDRGYPKLGPQATQLRDAYFKTLDWVNDNLLDNPKRKWSGYSYMIKMYIVVSYTPSSEGWWLDGRDNDYYVSDSAGPTQLFDVDGIVENIGNMMLHRSEKKRDKAEYNTANSLFPIDEDRIALVIQTRMNKIERRMIDYKEMIRRDSNSDITFDIRRTHMIDNTILMAFWNDMLTPYGRKVLNLRTNVEDVIIGMRRENAMATGDMSYLQDVREGNTLVSNDDDVSAFLDMFVGKTGDEVDLDFANDNQQTSDGSREGQVALASNNGVSALGNAWKNVDANLEIGDMSRKSEEEAYLDSFRHRTVSNNVNLGNDVMLQDTRNVRIRNDEMSTNVSYRQTVLSDEIRKKAHEEEYARYHDESVVAENLFAQLDGGNGDERSINNSSNLRGGAVSDALGAPTTDVPINNPFDITDIEIDTDTMLGNGTEADELATKIREMMSPSPARDDDLTESQHLARARRDDASRTSIRQSNQRRYQSQQMGRNGHASDRAHRRDDADGRIRISERNATNRTRQRSMSDRNAGRRPDTRARKSK